MIKRPLAILSVLVWGLATLWGSGLAQAQAKAAMQLSKKDAMAQAIQANLRKVTPAQRKAAAARAAARRAQAMLKIAPAAKTAALAAASRTAMNPGGTPDYFNVANWTNSPLPKIDPLSGKVIPGTGIRKFVDSLPGLGAANKNNLGQYLPVAIPDTTTYPGSDYYEISLVEYAEKMHSDLPPTKLRGYVQTNTTDPTVKVPHNLGPIIVAQRNRPVRVKFTNKLAIGSGGNLFLPVDTTVMGAGMGPKMMLDANGNMMMNPDGSMMMESYTQNRGTIHLHGGNTPWISDGTAHQWTTPAGEKTSYPKGVSVQNVPDMPDPGPGSLNFFYTNQQSARLMFYHDHSYGITRLNVYAGEAAGYLISDPAEQNLISSGAIPAEQIPLIIQDKTFVPDLAQLAATDPTWDTSKWGGYGQLWFPHVYMPNQNPADELGINAFGRWDYGPWFWPPVTTSAGLKHGPVQIGVDALGLPVYAPGTPDVSMTMEAFMDTPVINGTAYPFLKVGRKAYRFRILNACDDRYLNLQLYFAKSNTIDSTDSVTGLPTLQTDSGEVVLIPYGSKPWPAYWPTPDSRGEGWPDPTTVGPSMIQIGTEGGFLPKPAVLPNTPVGFDMDKRSITVLNVKEHTLFLGPAERADVIIDFSQVPDGSKLILYNDSPAPVPAGDTRLDYFTGDTSQTITGGAPTTLPGYGPNTRTIMQFQVSGTATAPFSTAKLASALPAAFAASQPPMIVPEVAYGAATNRYAHIADTALTFLPAGSATPITVPMEPKCIQELFELEYGRMNSTLGVELPLTNFLTQTTIPLGFIDPPTEVIKEGQTQIWKVTHNGVDTHAIHFHLYDVQLINRVDWAGVVKPPDANELGWKDTVRMNPLEDAVVALRPHKPNLSWPIPDSVRPLDPTMPLGSTSGFTNVDPVTGRPITVTNQLYNFGWEYMWHCHLLSHEEMDMMRPVVFQVAPAAPSNLVASLPAKTRAVKTAAAPTALSANLSWKDNSVCATGFAILRATDANFTQGLANSTVGALPTDPATAYAPAPTAYADTTVAKNTTYYYQVKATSPNGVSPASNITSITITGVPDPASNLTATQTGPNQVTLNWSFAQAANPDASIRIERADASGVFSAIKTVASTLTTFVNDLVPDGAIYSYRVIAFNTVGDAPASNTAAITLPLLAPSNLAALMSAQSPLTITINWTDNSLNETGFTIQRATNAAFTVGLTTLNAGANATSFINTNPVAGNTYYYRVCATNTAFTSAWSSPVSIILVAPAAPSNLTGMASPLSANPPTVTLAWTDNANNEAGLTIQRSTNSNFSQNVVSFTALPNATGYTDTTPPANTRVYYRVRAFNGVGTSGWSNSFNLTTPGQLPLDPTNLTLVTASTSRSRLAIAWTDNSNNEQGFYVERSTAGFNGPWTRINTTNANSVSYSNSNLSRNTTYWYRVQAYNNGVSGFTNVISGTTLP